MNILTQKEINHMEIVENQLRQLNEHLSRIADAVERLVASTGTSDNGQKEERQ